MVDPDRDDELRSAFAAFRADALDAVAAPDAADIKETAQRRTHQHRVVGGVAAAVFVLAGAGVAMVTTHTPPIGRPDVNTAATETAHRATRTPAPTDNGANHRPTRHPSPSASAPPSDQWGVAVAVAKPQVPLTQQRGANQYTGTVSMTLSNTGAAALPQVTVELTVPASMSYTGSDGTTCAAGNTCQLAQQDGLAPGDTYTVSGTLTFRSGSASPPAETTASATVRAVVTDTDGTELATDSHPITVSLRGSSTPSPSPSPSPPPSPNPTESPTGDSEPQQPTP